MRKVFYAQPIVYVQLMRLISFNMKPLGGARINLFGGALSSEGAICHTELLKIPSARKMANSC